MAGVASGPLARSSDELNALFGERPAGPIPSGIGHGTAILAAGTAAARPLAELAKMLFWQGKVFDGDRHDLLNLLTPFSLRAIRAEVYEEASWIDKKPCIVLDYAKSSLVARSIRDEIRQLDDGTYLGVVFVGKRQLPLYFHLDFAAPATKES
jgi:hypothetical protein